MEVKFQEFQENVKKDLQTETEQLTKRCELETQKLDKQVTAKLDSGIRSVYNKISQVQKEVDLELTAVKQNINMVPDKVEKKLNQQLSQTNIVVEELATVQFSDSVDQLESKLTTLGPEVNAIRDKVQQSAEVISKRPWERVKQTVQRDKASMETQMGRLGSQVVELRELVLTRNDAVPHVPSSSIGSIVSENNVHEGNTTGCSTGSVNASTGTKVNFVNNADRAIITHCVLSNSELSLPLFGEKLEVNPMFHFKQLTEFIKLKEIPQAHQLAVASKSIIGKLSRQWLEAISDKLKNYDDFRQAFLSTWWSPSQQSFVRCNIYQSRYDRWSGLTLSGHFLKYATMASHLEPRPSDIELIEAIRYHFPIQVQRVMLGTQLHSIGEALDLLNWFVTTSVRVTFHLFLVCRRRRCDLPTRAPCI
jgi:hypothetical protein